MALAIFGYFLGFLSNLFKAVESDPFIVPSPDLHTAYSGLLNLEHLKLAFAVVGIILLIILFVVVKGRFDSRNHDDRNFSVSEKGTYGTAAYLSEKQAKRLLTSDNEHSLLAVSRIFGSENGIILGTFPNGHIVTKRAIEKEQRCSFLFLFT